MSDVKLRYDYNSSDLFRLIDANYESYIHLDNLTRFMHKTGYYQLREEDIEGIL